MLSRCRPLLGTLVEVTADRQDAIEAAFAAVAKVHRLMSAHEPDSDVSRINRFAHFSPVEVDEWTAGALERALYWAKQSHGAFDPVRAGEAALGRGAIPRHREQPCPQALHWTCLELHRRSVQLARPGCIDLGGIAKGVAVDRAVEALRRAGCERGLVNAGGDLAGFGSEAWPVAIADPLTRRPVASVEIANQALATSAGLPGAGSLSFDHLGGRHARWTSVSVVAPIASDADALTKIVWAAGGALLADAGAKALAITDDGQVEAVAEAVELAI